MTKPRVPDPAAALRIAKEAIAQARVSSLIEYRRLNPPKSDRPVYNNPPRTPHD